MTKSDPNIKKQDTGNKDPLHGVTLKMMLEELLLSLGWEGLRQRININCFKSNPSIKSSLTFLRRTPWAREKVENLYLKSKGHRPVALCDKSRRSDAKVTKSPAKKKSSQNKSSSNPWLSVKR